MDAACLHAGGRCTNDANRHEREAMRSSTGTRMAVSGPEAAKQRGTKKPAARTAGSWFGKPLCYSSESAVSSAFTILFTAVRRALTEARMISTSTPAPQYNTPLFLLLTPT